MLHSQPVYTNAFRYFSLAHFRPFIFVDKQNAVALSDKPWHCLVSYVDDLTGKTKLLIFYLVLLRSVTLHLILWIRLNLPKMICLASNRMIQNQCVIAMNWPF